MKSSNFKLEKVTSIISVTVPLGLGLSLLIKPEDVSEFAIRLIGVVFILNGILRFIKYFNSKKKM